MTRQQRPKRRAKTVGGGSTKGLAERTSIAEWTAAAAGLALTLGVLGYSLWEGLTGASPHPALRVEAEPASETASGFVVPVILRNDSEATAGSVRITGVLEREGRIVESRSALFDYAPGKGESRGGLVFQRDPGAHHLTLTVEGFQEP